MTRRGTITLTWQQRRELGRRLDKLARVLTLQARFIARQTVADRRTP